MQIPEMCSFANVFLCMSIFEMSAHTSACVNKCINRHYSQSKLLLTDN